MDSLTDRGNQAEIELFEIKKERDVVRFTLEQVSQVLKRMHLFEQVMSEVSSS